MTFIPHMICPGDFRLKPLIMNTRYAQPQPWPDGSPGFWTAINGVRMAAPIDPGRDYAVIPGCCGVPDRIAAPFQDEDEKSWYTFVDENGYLEVCDCGAVFPRLLGEAA